MSRYNLGRGVEVGFDPPLNTFFAQLYDADEDLVDDIESPHLAPIWDHVLTQWGVAFPQGVLEKLVEESKQPWTPGPLQEELGFEARP